MAKTTMQTLHTKDGKIVETVDHDAAMVTLRRWAGSKGDLTVGNGRISAYSREFRPGEDNSVNLCGYATRAN